MDELMTPRLLLRSWQEGDLNCGVYDPPVIRMLMRRGDNYALMLRESGRVIGSVGLNEDALNAPGTRNVGVLILPEYEGQGLMSEAVRAVIAHPPQGVTRLSWIAREDDPRSLHLARKLGFARQGLLRDGESPALLVYHTLDISEDIP